MSLSVQTDGDLMKIIGRCARHGTSFVTWEELPLLTDLKRRGLIAPKDGRGLSDMIAWTVTEAGVKEFS